MLFRFDPSRGNAPGLTKTQGFWNRVTCFPKKTPELGILLNLLFSFQRPTFPAPESSAFAFFPAAGSGIISICEGLSKQKEHRRDFFLCCRLRSLREQVCGLLGVISHDQVGARPTHRN